MSHADRHLVSKSWERREISDSWSLISCGVDTVLLTLNATLLPYKVISSAMATIISSILPLLCVCMYM